MLYNVVLVSAIQKHESAMVYTYPLPLESPSHLPLHPPLEVVVERQAELPAALYRNFPSAIYFTHGNMYFSATLPSHPTLSFPQYVHKSVLCLSLYSRGQETSF